MTSSLPVASPSSASQFLKAHEDEFIHVVNAKQSLLKLKHKGVISQAVRTSIEGANDEDAKYLLFEHLVKNATVDTLREYCNVAIAADRFPQMQELGRKLLNALPLGGWLNYIVLYSNVHCICMCAFVTLCIIHACV